MKKQILAIIITAGLCVTAILVALGFIVRGTRIQQQNTMLQSNETALHNTNVFISITPTITETITPTPIATPTATPTIKQTVIPTPIPTTTPAPVITAIPAVTQMPTAIPNISNGHIVAIDPGHQAKGNYEKEPLGPGSSEMKAKVASGTSGRYTGVDEYIVTLDVSLLLRDELEKRGYQVVMIRETHDVNISNSERAAIANNSGAEIFIRVHCNGVDDSSVKGALTMAPTQSNPYVSNIASECTRLSQLIIDEYCDVTGFRNKGIQYVDNMSGINWCKIPVTIIEMGFMTNAEDDAALVNPAMQKKMAEGIANGIDAYFGL